MYIDFTTVAKPISAFGSVYSVRAFHKPEKDSCNLRFVFLRHFTKKRHSGIPVRLCHALFMVYQIPDSV